MRQPFVIIIACLLPALAPAQTADSASRIGPWYAWSVGGGRIYVGDATQPAAGLDIALGVTHGQRVRFGVRTLFVSEIDVAGTSINTRTVSAVGGYSPGDGLLTFIAGVGHMTTDAGSADGTGMVLETGLEVALPRRKGLSFRLVALSIWPVTPTRWEGPSIPSGNAAVTHFGIGMTYR